MSLQLLLFSLMLLLVGAGLWEYRSHLRNLRSIRIRIHVNGTRGKSSVTRLIAAGLRAGGLRVYAKTTGTLPRMIMEDGSEFPVYRPSKANIIEQLRIVALAASEGADALVIECMALQPVLQTLTELKMVRATIGVITNARPDHLDVMGPSERDVALALLGSTPVGGVLCTAEHDHVALFEMACRDRGTRLFVVGREQPEAITDEQMSRFSYREHKENVALALEVCALAGVPRDQAFRGMCAASPDPGAMQAYLIDFFGRNILFINGFAANDPESSERIWQMALDRHPSYTTRIMVLNCRADRPDRSRQLGEAVPTWTRATRYVVMGSGAYVFVKYAVIGGLEPGQIVNAEGLPTDRIFEAIVGVSGRRSLVMGIGNIGGGGLELVDYFNNRTILDANLEEEEQQALLGKGGGQDESPPRQGG
ncbi:MAG: poly-gamma-glutamate synthase PgsB [Deltaproteobacteria bacterium]|nr:poly-gamma-glutamate synthase PgsB [Deltaproteobacteria bacterium]